MSKKIEKNQKKGGSGEGYSKLKRNTGRSLKKAFARKIARPSKKRDNSLPRKNFPRQPFFSVRKKKKDKKKIGSRKKKNYIRFEKDESFFRRIDLRRKGRLTFFAFPRRFRTLRDKHANNEKEKE